MKHLTFFLISIYASYTSTCYAPPKLCLPAKLSLDSVDTDSDEEAIAEHAHKAAAAISRNAILDSASLGLDKPCSVETPILYPRPQNMRERQINLFALAIEHAGTYNGRNTGLTIVRHEKRKAAKDMQNPYGCTRDTRITSSVIMNYKFGASLFCSISFQKALRKDSELGLALRKSVDLLKSLKVN